MLIIHLTKKTRLFHPVNVSDNIATLQEGNSTTLP